MEDGQTGGQLFDVDSQINSQVSDASEGQAAERPVEWPVERPSTPAAIAMEALLAITQALKLTNTGPRTEIRPPSFNGEDDLSLFLKQFDDVAVDVDVADANQWTLVQRTLHLRNQLTGDTQGCGHGDSYIEIAEDLHARFGGPNGRHVTGWQLSR